VRNGVQCGVGSLMTGTLGYVIGTPLGCAVGQALRALTAV